jgi:biotin carboxylase
MAARILGLPIAVKSRMGLGGDGVRIAHSVEALERARKALDRANRHGLFYQAYVGGAAVGYSCIQGPRGPLLEHGFRIGARQWEFGPSAQISLDDDPRLLEAGRRAVAALGCQGFAQIDFIQDADGRFWAIDANLRPWGNVLSLLCLGIDFVEAYLALILAQPYAAPRPATGLHKPQAVFPHALYDAVRGGSLRLVAAHVDGFVRMCRRGPGAIYGLIVAAKAASLLIERLARRPAPLQPRRRAPSVEATGPEIP